MATVIPFRGLVYNTKHVPDVNLVVSPPYDVITAEMDEEFRRRHLHNIVHLILPRPDGESDRYTCAAGLLKQWRKEEILIQDEKPAFYLMAQKYCLKGMGEKTRFGLVARLRIEDDETRTILPHERTMPGPREDRTDLLQATRTNLSQIFLLYSDPGGVISGALEPVASHPADRWAADDAGIESSFWRITDGEILEHLTSCFREKTLWIADGHHRYSAARAYRNQLRAADGSEPGTRAYDYVMAYLTCMESPGVSILPYHRALRGRESLTRASLAEAARRYFDVKEFPFEGERARPDQIRRRLLDGSRTGRTAIAAYTGPGSFLVLLLKDCPEASQALARDLEEPLRTLDVSVLHHLLFQDCLGISKEQQSGEDGPLRFTGDMERALAWVDSGEAQAALLLNATLKEQLVAVADHGLQMPQKSTFFYPKVLTGLVLNPLEPVEEVHLSSMAAG